jgi:hypothetical protein
LSSAIILVVLFLFAAAFALILIGIVLILYRYEKTKLLLAELRHAETLRQIDNLNLDVSAIKRSMNSRGNNI